MTPFTDAAGYLESAGDILDVVQRRMEYACAYLQHAMDAMNEVEPSLSDHGPDGEHLVVSLMARLDTQVYRLLPDLLADIEAAARTMLVYDETYPDPEEEDASC